MKAWGVYRDGELLIDPTCDENDCDRWVESLSQEGPCEKKQVHILTDEKLEAKIEEQVKDKIFELAAKVDSLVKQHEKDLREMAEIACTRPSLIVMSREQFQDKCLEELKRRREGKMEDEDIWQAFERVLKEHGHEGGISMEDDAESYYEQQREFAEAEYRKEEEHFELDKMNRIAQAEKSVALLTDEERLELFGEYCPICGKHDPSKKNTKCKCWKDE